MDPQQRLCAGCYRTLDEIARWAEMSDAERARVLAVLPQRRDALGQATPPPAAIRGCK
jgi:uncharacterized protein